VESYSTPEEEASSTEVSVTQRDAAAVVGKIVGFLSSVVVCIVTTRRPLIVTVVADGGMIVGVA